MVIIKNANTKRSYTIWGILILVLIADLFIFKFITNKPLGLAPSNLDESPKIYMSAEAAPNIPLKINNNEPFELVPSLSFSQLAKTEKEDLQVIGFGKKGKDLYIQVRLYKNLDLSLKKGWGKAFQLIDEENKSYLYDSYSLPFGVQLYDKLVDLPDDFRANINLTKNGYKDIFLHFPSFPLRSTPARLRLIEAFQGNSPANPGHIFYDLPLTEIEEKYETSAILSHESFERILNTNKTIPTDPEVILVLEKILIDDNLIPKACIKFLCEIEKKIIINDGILVGKEGDNYSMFQLEDQLCCRTCKELDDKIEIMFERIPRSTTIKSLCLFLTIDEEDLEVLISL